MRLTELGTAMSEQGWTLVRALPRDSQHALLQLSRGGAQVVAGQWFADRDRAARVAEQTAARGGKVDRPLPGVLVQHDGADRKLSALADRCAAGGRLRAHRPERRAVVEVDGGSRFVKIVRPDRVRALVQTMARRFDGVPTPRVLEVEERTGSVTTAALPGDTLHALLTGDADALPGTMHEIGATLGRLHAGPTRAGVAVHGPAAELAVVDRWIGLAARFGGDMQAARAARSRLPELLVARRRQALLHRDLHDKQIVLGPDGPALLDLDLLAVGDPALDLANLAVHLELRSRQGLLPMAAAGEAVAALLEGYRPGAATRAAATGYLLATRVRLAAVYSFRPAAGAAAARLLTDPVIEELT